jgi:hypothetical protein
MDTIKLDVLHGSANRIPVGERFSSPVQIGSEAHTASCTTRTGSLPQGKNDRDVALTTHLSVGPRLKKK